VQDFEKKLDDIWRFVMSIVSWIVVGLVGGWLAGLVVRGGGYGLIGDIIIGIAGGLLGGWIATAFLHIGAAVNGINLESVGVAFGGAVLLILILRLFNGSRRRCLTC
jgi:uncharacterized membrane protein YeaQ/YmgE (transglycosylase-associated protein family)